MRSWFAIVTVCASLVGDPAVAWWDGGHTQIAAVAYERLDPAVRAKVDALIKLNPDYSKWVDGVADADRDRSAFVHASTWADDIKGEAGYIDSGDTPTSHNAARNIGYSDKLRHKHWHFIDLPFSPDGTAVRPPDPVNALTQIKALTATLASSASDDVKSYDLVWLIHLVGDAHQPLHATSRFTAADPGDNGGNSETVTPTNAANESLHAFWDALLGDRLTPDQATSMAASLPRADPVRAARADPQVWFDESEAAAEVFAYAQPIGEGDGPYTLTDDYQQKAIDVAHAQAAVAGARLAALLNAAFAGP
jgi:S1/P1 Nuclease